MEEKEYSNVYAIPANYTDSGKLLGGMKRDRNSLTSGTVGVPGTFPDSHARNHTNCGHDSDIAAFGSDFGDGCGWRFVVPVSRTHCSFLDSSAKTAFQEDRISL